MLPDSITDGEDEALITGEREELDVPQQTDFWSMPNHDILVRNHVIPRTELYVPTDAECPLPVRYLDILRTTKTVLDHADHQEVNDHWTENA